MIDCVIHTHSFGRLWVCSPRDLSIPPAPRCSSWPLLPTEASHWPHILQSRLIGRRAGTGWSKCKSDEATFSNCAYTTTGVERSWAVWCQIRNDHRCARVVQGAEWPRRTLIVHVHTIRIDAQSFSMLDLKCHATCSKVSDFDEFSHLDERANPVRIRTGSTLTTKVRTSKGRRLILRCNQRSMIRFFL